MTDLPFDPDSVAEPMARHWRALKDDLMSTHGDVWCQAVAVALGAMLRTLIAVADQHMSPEALIVLLNKGFAASGGGWRLVKDQ
jgi:hypothetical protein